MRIISQNGAIDVPYDYFSLTIATGKYEDVEVACIDCHNLSSPEGTKLAEYSSEDKAQKVIDMLREQYSRLQVVKILASGTCEHMEKSLSKDEFLECNLKYREMNIFQFPKDEYVEV